MLGKPRASTLLLEMPASNEHSLYLEIDEQGIAVLCKCGWRSPHGRRTPARFVALDFAVHMEDG